MPIRMCCSPQCVWACSCDTHTYVRLLLHSLRMCCSLLCVWSCSYGTRMYVCLFLHSFLVSWQYKYNKKHKSKKKHFIFCYYLYDGRQVIKIMSYISSHQLVMMRENVRKEMMMTVRAVKPQQKYTVASTSMRQQSWVTLTSWILSAKKR